MPQQPPHDDSQPCASFEQALEELQGIVTDLEAGSLGLEESMRRFEKGIGLLRSCYQTLENAEQKIQILTGQDAEGNPVTAPFDATATVETQAGKRRRAARSETKVSKQQTSETDSDDAEGMLF